MSSERNKYYFLSDFHLGIPCHNESLERERIIVKWLDSISNNAKEIFIMGDVFDFWFEYKTVVPKGYVRLLAKIAELVESGIVVHLFKGNHDLWEFSYLEQELGVIYHRRPENFIINNKKVHIAHGDGLGPNDFFYKFLLKIFECKILQFLYRWIHPDMGIRFGLLLSNKHRYTKRHNSGKDKNINIKNEALYKYALEQVKINPDIDYLIFGHRHIPICTNIPESKAKMTILGDWMIHFSYVVIDENGEMTLQYLK